MSLPDKTNVLIVGAGPAGLATAISLLHQGVQDLTIVDAVPQGQNSSRAITIHAATLEASIRHDRLWRRVRIQRSKNYCVQHRNSLHEAAESHIESLESYTQHPYILILTQNVTERILAKKLASLGVTIHRPLRAVGLKPSVSNPQLSDVIFEDGSVITTTYVIGADGARSVVRSMAGIGFSDPTLVEGEADSNLAQMALGDITFDTDIAEASPSMTISPRNIFLCFPLPYSYNESLAAEGKVSVSDKIYRIGCGVPLEEGEIPHAPSKKFLQDLVDRFGPYRFASDLGEKPNPKVPRIKDVVFSSRFRNRAAAADTPFTRLGGGESGEGGVVLLVGDAAHIHSPAGGQGMNLGIRDATFLAEALTKHIRASESQPLSEADKILHEFATTRHARALEVIKLTKGILSVAGMKYRERVAWWCPIDSATVRACVMWVVGCIPFIRDRMAWQLSGLGRR